MSITAFKFFLRHVTGNTLCSTKSEDSVTHVNGKDTVKQPIPLAILKV